ncbi:hypothetical protein EN873_46650, partial [bacterium M00.F.Ca.ET.230.01.1.1]
SNAGAWRPAKRHCYFSFEDMIRTNDAGYFPYTPATQLLRGLRASLDLIAEGGLENSVALADKLQSAARRKLGRRHQRPQNRADQHRDDSDGERP